MQLPVLPIAKDGPGPGEGGIEDEDRELGEEVGDCRTLDVDATHSLNKVAERIDEGNLLGPLRSIL